MSTFNNTSLQQRELSRRTWSNLGLVVLVAAIALSLITAVLLDYYIAHGLATASVASSSAPQGRVDLATQVHDEDARINDINNRFSDLSVFLGGFGILVAIVGVGLSFLALFTAGQRATDAAKEWMDNHNADIHKNIETLNAKYTDAIRVFEAKVEEIQRVAGEARGKIEQAAYTGKSPDLSEDEKKALSETTNATLKNKPEAEYTSSDWAELAISEYAKQQFALAADHFRRAATAADATNATSVRYLVMQSSALYETGRLEEGLVVLNAVITTFGDSSDASIREIYAIALYNKGVFLAQLGREEDAITAYGDVFSRLKDATDPSMREWVAKSLFNKGATLGRLGRSEEAIASYDEVDSLFKDATEPQIRQQVASALNNKAYELGLMGRRSEEIEICDKAIASFKGAPESSIHTSVVMAMSNKGEAFGVLGRNAEALDVLNEASALYANIGDDPEFVRAMAWIAFKKAVTLGRLDRIDEGRSAFGEVIARFGGSTNSEIRRLVEKAVEFKDSAENAWGYPEPAWFT